MKSASDLFFTMLPALAVLGFSLLRINFHPNEDRTLFYGVITLLAGLMTSYFLPDAGRDITPAAQHALTFANNICLAVGSVGGNLIAASAIIKSSPGLQGGASPDAPWYRRMW